MTFSSVESAQDEIKTLWKDVLDIFENIDQQKKKTQQTKLKCFKTKHLFQNFEKMVQ